MMIPITKPTLPEFEGIVKEFKEIFSSGMITNYKFVDKLEKQLQGYLKVKHAIAVSSCTSGLMLVLKVLNLTGEIIVPSFTFSASGHAILWNNLTPKFVDIDPKTYNIDVNKIKEAINEKTTAILAVHLFGCPSNVDQLQKIATENNLRLIFDAAHCIGSKVNDKFIGNFGDAEIFSCSPTKLMITGEGGIVTTNDDELARRIRIGRTYGDPGDYDCEFPGLSARMSEFHGLLGLHSLEMLESNIEKRNNLVVAYKEELSMVPGISFQEIPNGCRSTFKDFSILIEPAIFKINRDLLGEELKKKGIQTKKYFYPPLHIQKAYNKFRKASVPFLETTMVISENILSLPLYSHMSLAEVKEICRQIGFIHKSYC